MPLKTLKEVYDAYALFGSIGRADTKSGGLDNRNYIKLCRDAGLNRFMGSAELDMTFIQALQSRGTAGVRAGAGSNNSNNNNNNNNNNKARRLTFGEFMRVVKSFGDKLNKSSAEVTAFMLMMLRNGPKTAGTTAAVRFHDDATSYTGVSRNGGVSVVDSHNAGFGTKLDRDVRNNKVNHDKRQATRRSSIQQMRTLSVEQQEQQQQEQEQQQQQQEQQEDLMKRQQHNFQRFASSIKNTSNNSSHTHTTYNSVQSTTTTTTGQESPIPMTFFASANTAAAAAATATATAARLADNQSARELQQFLARANNVLASLGKGCLEESLKDERIRKETNKFLSGAQQSVGRWTVMTANKNEAEGSLRTRMFEVDHVLQRELSRLDALEESLRAQVDEGAALEESIFQIEARLRTRDPHCEGSNSRGHSGMTKVTKKVTF